MTVASVSIAGRKISHAEAPYVVAEISGNHNGKLESALRLIELAAECGADAVKFQTYTPETMTIDAPQPDFRVSGGLWDGYRLYELYRWAHTPWAWHEALFDRAQRVGITAFSTPFDETAVDFLRRFNPPAYKIASFEAVDQTLIRYVAEQSKPMVVSTGMASKTEIEMAVTAASEAGCQDIVLLHCVSAYPATPVEAGLRAIPRLSKDYGLPVGMSDHTLGNGVACAAVAVGAVKIEKHVTLNRSEGGPDAAFSLEPEQFARLCRDCHDSWEAMQSDGVDRTPGETDSLVFRRSIYVVQDMKEGEAFSTENVRRIRPGYGLAARYWPEILGRYANRDLVRGMALSWDVVVGGSKVRKG